MGAKRRSSRGRHPGVGRHACGCGAGDHHEVDQARFLEELQELDALAMYDPDDPDQDDHHQEFQLCL